MTITIELPQDTLTALQADAGAQGRPAEQVAAELLAALYAEPDDEDAAVGEALRELDAGQGRPFTEFSKEFSDRFTAPFRAAEATR